MVHQIFDNFNLDHGLIEIPEDGSQSLGGEG